MKANKQAYIDLILDELNSGNIYYKDVLLVFVGKFGLSEQTFIRYWKLANEAYKLQREELNQSKQEEVRQAEIEAAKAAILSRQAALEILTKIAEGKARRVEGNVIAPNDNERIKAIDTIGRMEGWDTISAAKIKEIELEGKAQHTLVLADGRDMQKILDELKSEL
jgi:hypothetical protein